MDAIRFATDGGHVTLRKSEIVGYETDEDGPEPIYSAITSFWKYITIGNYERAKPFVKWFDAVYGVDTLNDDGTIQRLTIPRDPKPVTDAVVTKG